jgi:hypothetical protein
MSGITMTAVGLKEMIADVKSSRTGIPTAIYMAMAASMAIVARDVKTYPPQKPPRNPKRIYIRGVGTRYLPTKKTYRTSERYGATTVYRVLREDNAVVGYVNSKASYANWLRGTLERMHEQADQHTNWETLREIADRNMPLIVARVNVAVTDYLKRNGL